MVQNVQSSTLSKIVATSTSTPILTTTTTAKLTSHLPQLKTVKELSNANKEQSEEEEMIEARPQVPKPDVASNRQIVPPIPGKKAKIRVDTAAEQFRLREQSRTEDTDNGLQPDPVDAQKQLRPKQTNGTTSTATNAKSIPERGTSLPSNLLSTPITTAPSSLAFNESELVLLAQQIGLEAIRNQSKFTLSNTDHDEKAKEDEGKQQTNTKNLVLSAESSREQQIPIDGHLGRPQNPLKRPLASTAVLPKESKTHFSGPSSAEFARSVLR